MYRYNLLSMQRVSNDVNSQMERDSCYCGYERVLIQTKLSIILYIVSDENGFKTTLLYTTRCKHETKCMILSYWSLIMTMAHGMARLAKFGL